MLTEVHMVFPEAFDNERKWRIYLALSEVSKALMALLAMSWAPRMLKPSAMLAAVWYTTQAQQEFTGQNEGTTETWEYYLVALMATAIALQLTLTRK